MKIYSAHGVSFIFAGINVESGKGVDVFARIAQLTEAYTTEVGVDGEVTRSETGDKRCRVTLILRQTADSNDLLSAVHLLDTKTRNGSGVGPLMVRDRQGTSVLIDPEAFIEKFPDQEFGKASGDLEWSFIAPNPERFVGGN